MFESVAYEYSMWDAMKAPHPGPYLCRLTFVQCDLQIDLRGIRTTGGDFNMGDLEERITPLVDSIANAIRQEIGTRKTLVFTPDVGSAQAIASALRSLNFEAEAVWGNDPDRERKIRQLHSGKTQILVNCALLTEGFDCQDIAAVVLCRPTKSRPLYAQMVGRGTRIAQGKDNCLIVDFDYLTSKHDLVKPTELFDGTHTDSEMLDIAMDLAKKDKTLALDEAIEKAGRIKEERAIVRVKAREREMKYKKVSYDPLAVCDTFGLPWRGTGDAVAYKATEGQAKALKNMGIDNPESLSRTRAKTLLDMLFARRKANLATHKQVAWLLKMGVDAAEARAMSFENAKTKLDELFSRGRK